MSKTCAACRHPRRAQLDEALRSGIPYRELTERFGISKSALSRHRADHLNPVPVVPIAAPPATPPIKAAPVTEPRPESVRTVPNESDICRYCFKTGAGYEWFINYRHVWAHGCGREWDGPSS